MEAIHKRRRFQLDRRFLSDGDDDLEQFVNQTVGLDELESPIQAILQGQITGRTLVQVAALDRRS